MMTTSRARAAACRRSSAPCSASIASTTCRASRSRRGTFTSCARAIRAVGGRRARSQSSRSGVAGGGDVAGVVAGAGGARRVPRGPRAARARTRVRARGRLRTRAGCRTSCATSADEPDVRCDALARLAVLLGAPAVTTMRPRRGRACWICWARGARQPRALGRRAAEALAIHHEHRARNLSAAKRYAESLTQRRLRPIPAGGRPPARSHRSQTANRRTTAPRSA